MFCAGPDFENELGAFPEFIQFNPKEQFGCSVGANKAGFGIGKMLCVVQVGRGTGVQQGLREWNFKGVLKFLLRGVLEAEVALFFVGQGVQVLACFQE